MSWSSRSAGRIELRPWGLGDRILACTAAVGISAGVVAYSSIPLIAYTCLPLICAAVWWAGKQSAGYVMLLSSNSDQLKLGSQQYRLIDFGILAETVAIRLEDGNGMRKNVLMGPWNCSAEDRRLSRLWLARHAGGTKH